MEKRGDHVHREHPIFLFLVDMSIFYWWAKIPSFLPRPNKSYSLLNIFQNKHTIITNQVQRIVHPAAATGWQPKVPQQFQVLNRTFKN